VSEAAERYRQAKEIFLLALQRDGSERDAYLAEACGGDAALRSEVEALLVDDRTRGNALDRLDHAPQGPTLPPDYRVLRELGRGGMGVVWLAERDTGDFKQKVALKLLGHDALRDPDRRARFRAERRILASLDHPHIARLLDGGALADGTPFLAMEFVEGERLDAWAERSKPTLRGLISMFVAICRAVQAAHQRLVVHRDLKPANILVDAYGEPKLLDFGIAKLLDDSAEIEVATGTGMQLLTPRYAAPEQVRGEAITTATDVYALGVILYELLTGASPYGRAAATPDQLRAICDTEPQRPSAVMTAAQHTSGTSSAQLRGDLDAILLKCLRKAPAARYRGAAELADDLEAFLDGRPVAARAGSTRYALGKFVSRHRTLVASSVLVLGVLLAATLLLQRQLEETRTQRDLAAEERDRAQRERDRAEAVTRFMKRLFREANPYMNDGRSLSVVDAVEKGAAALEANDSLTPSARGALQSSLSEVMRSLGSTDAALAMSTKSLSSLRSARDVEPLQLAEALLNHASLLQDKSRYDEAVQAYQEGLAFAEGADEVLAADFVSRLGSLENERDDLQASARYLRDSRERLLRHLGHADLDAALLNVESGAAADLLSVVVANECAAAERAGEFEQALRACERSLELKRRLYPGNEARLANTIEIIGNIYSRRGEHQLAARHHRQSLAIAERVHGPDHVNTGISLLNLGLDLAQTGDFAGGRSAYERSIQILTDRLGSEHRYTLVVRNNLANLLMESGDLQTALRMHREVLAARRRTLGPESGELSESLLSLAGVLDRVGEHTEARATLREALALVERVRPKEHFDVQVVRLALAEHLADSGELDEAVLFVDQAEPYFQGAGDNAQARAAILFLRARSLVRDQQRQDEAIDLARRALEVAEHYPHGDLVDAEEVRAWLAQRADIKR
jgi:serine/threonine-protein kinase